MQDYSQVGPRSPRWIKLAVNVFADGVVPDSDQPLLEGVPVVPKGEKMQGQFFPLLFDSLA